MTVKVPYSLDQGSVVVLHWRQWAGVQLLLTSRLSSRVIVVNIPQLQHLIPDHRTLYSKWLSHSERYLWSGIRSTQAIFGLMLARLPEWIWDQLPLQWSCANRVQGLFFLMRSVPRHPTTDPRSISPVPPLSSIGSLAESKTRNPLASLSHDNWSQISSDAYQLESAHSYSSYNCLEIWDQFWL